MIGRLAQAGCSRSLRMNSAPLRSGMLKSVIRRSGGEAIEFSSAATGCENVRTSISSPSEPASRSRIFRLVIRSSTIETVWRPTLGVASFGEPHPVICVFPPIRRFRKKIQVLTLEADQSPGKSPGLERPDIVDSLADADERHRDGVHLGQRHHHAAARRAVEL